MKLLIKGILTHEDASLCVEHGVDGIIVSNHGGRVVDSGLSTIEVLPEIARSVGGRILILIDSGLPPGQRFLQGAGAGRLGRLPRPSTSVGARRLRSGRRRGGAGHALREELEAIMRQMGTPTLEAITPAHVQPRG